MASTSTYLANTITSTLTISINEIVSSVTGFAPSLRYMRKMIPLIIENIIYNRIALDEGLFVKKSINDWEYKTFKAKTKHRLTCDVFNWCKTLASAIPKKTINKLYLLFVTDGGNTLIEHYRFDLKTEKAPRVVQKGAKLMEETKKFFTVINSLSEYTKLNPDEINILMEVQYNKNLSAEAMEMHNFELTSSPTCAGGDGFMLIGEVNTGYHKLRCDADGDIFHPTADSTIIEIDDDEDVEEARKTVEEDAHVNASPEVFSEPDSPDAASPEPEQHKSDKKRKRKREEEAQSMFLDSGESADEDGALRDSSDGSTSPTPTEMMEIIEKEERVTTPKRVKIRDTPDINYFTDDEGEDLAETPLRSDEFRPNPEISCLCDLRFSVGYSETVDCSVCERTMHTVCVGYEKADNIPGPFVCVSCSRKGRPATDVNLKGKKATEVRFKCAMRLVLRYCVVNKKYPEELVDRLGPVIRKNLKVYVAKVPGLEMHEDNTFSIQNFGELADWMAPLFYDFSDECMVDSMTL